MEIRVGPGCLTARMPLYAQPLGEGRPIVVLPSFSLDHNAMAATVEPALSTTAGWLRLYLDLPGTGGSPPGGL